LGDLRASEAVHHLVPLLDLPPGEVLSIESRPFHLCPAARALIKIGKPAIPAMLVILKDDEKGMRTSQAQLILYDVEGAGGGQLVLRTAIAAESDAARKANLERNLLVFEAMAKTDQLPAGASPLQP
jgi:hypothetical protein